MINSDKSNGLIFKDKPRFESYLLIFLLIILVYTPIFGYLGVLPMRIWDESRLAINAIEMIQTGNPFVTYFEGLPDLWNTKPPLMIWLQVISIKIFGLSDIATRLPSAISGLFTLIIIGLASHKITGNLWLPAIACLILITSNGYIHDHGTRSGDYDALLTFFITGYCLSMFFYLESGNKKYYRLFFLFVILAAFTKGIAAMLMIPGIIIYLIFSKKLVALFRLRLTYIGTFTFIILISAYYFLREYHHPGFLTSVLYNEITGRYLGNVENHKQAFDFYLKNLIETRYAYYFPILIAALVTNPFISNNLIRNFSNYISIVALLFFLVISTGSSKLHHYDLPLYPLMALITGIMIYNILILLKSRIIIEPFYRVNIIPIFLLLLFFMNPYRQIFAKTYKPTENIHDLHFYSLGYALKDLIKSPGNTKSVKIIYDEYKAHIDFYKYVLEKKGISVSYTIAGEIKNGDLVIVNDESELAQLPQDLFYKIVKTVKHAKFARILSNESSFNANKFNEVIPTEIKCYQSCSPWELSYYVNSEAGDTVISAFSDFESNFQCDEFLHHIITEQSYSGKHSVYMSPDHNFSASFLCKTANFKEYGMVQIEGFCFSPDSVTNADIVVKILNDGEPVETIFNKFKVNNFDPNSWVAFRQVILLPIQFPEDSEFLLYFYSDANHHILLDDIRITFSKFQ